jgi:hypothetical protein
MSIGNDFIVYVLRKSGANTYIHNGINKTFSFASKYRKELAIGGTITTLSVLSIYSIFRIYNLSSQLASAQTVQELLRTQFATTTLELAKNKMLQKRSQAIVEQSMLILAKSYISTSIQLNQGIVKPDDVLLLTTLLKHLNSSFLKENQDKAWLAPAGIIVAGELDKRGFFLPGNHSFIIQNGNDMMP